MRIERDITTKEQKQHFHEFLEEKDLALSSFGDDNRVYYAPNGSHELVKTIGCYFIKTVHSHGHYNTYISVVINDEAYAKAVLDGLEK